MKNVKIGIASFAHIHAFSYLEVLKSMEGVDILSFCDLDPARAKQVETTHRISNIDSYESLVSNDDLDAILVTTENLYHVDVALQAFENGKDVIVEKPIATTLQDAQKMIDASIKHGQRLFQCYPCRYHPSAQHVKELIESGQLGDIKGMTATNHGCMPDHTNPATAWFSNKKLAGGGAVMDHTTHVADLLFWFTGWEPKHIFGIAKNLFYPEIDSDDAGMVLVNYGNGVSASIDPSWSRPVAFPTWGDLTMTIYGSSMTVEIDMFNQNFNLFSNSSKKSAQLHSFSSNVDENMLAAYINAMRTGDDPPVNGKDGYNALKVALKAYESNDANKVVDW